MVENRELLLFADPAQSFRHQRVDGVRKARREVMLDLEIEAAHQPVQRPTAELRAAADVDRCVQLMVDEVAAAARRVRRREGGGLSAVGELKHGGEERADTPRHREVEGQHHPPAVVHQRQSERPANVHNLAERQHANVPATRLTGESLTTDPVVLQIDEVGDQQPLQGEKAVQNPHVQMLIAVPRSPLLSARSRSWRPAGRSYSRQSDLLCARC